MNRTAYLVIPPLKCTGFERFIPRHMQRPQLGILTLSSILRKAGADTRVIDLNARPVSPARLSRMLAKKRNAWVGLYSNSLAAGEVVDYVEAIKSRSPETPIVVGGPGHTEYRRYLRAGASAVARGEADSSIVLLSRALQSDIGLQDVPGIFYRQNGEILQTPPAPVVNDLDSIPFPDSGAVNLHDYRDAAVFFSSRPYFTAMASRGCPFKCAFCFSGNIAENRHRTRSVENVLEETELLIRQRGVRYIAFQDDIFGVPKGWIERYCEGILRKNLKFGWSVILHPTSFRGRRREIFAMMKTAGMNMLSFGAQSAVPQVLRRINRSPKEPGLLWEALEVADELRIMTATEYIFGLPGDSEETLQENIRFARSCRATLVNFHGLVLLPGIPLMDKIESGQADLPPRETVSRYLIKAWLSYYSDPRTIARISSYGLRALLGKVAAVAR